MKAITKNFAVVFLVGFVALAAALGLGSIEGQVLSDNPTLAALRLFGGGTMLAGLSLWIALLRDEGGKPGLNPLLGLLGFAGVLVLIVNLLNPASSYSSTLGWGGLGLAAAALVLGLLSMLIAPAFAQPPTSRWPEGGEATPGHHPGGESH